MLRLGLPRVLEYYYSTRFFLFSVANVHFSLQFFLTSIDELLEFMGGLIFNNVQFDL